MSQTLALKYRPATFEDVTGQRATTLTLKAMVARGAVPTGMLFIGVRGTGKTSMGRILAAALNCLAEPGIPRPCTACASCLSIAAGRSLDVREMDAASNGNVGAIRTLVENLRYSVGGAYRVVLLDEAHSMSRDAFDALLKTLEEPPDRTIFILLTTEPGKILETVRSRLMPFEFGRLSTGDIVVRLEHICAHEGFSVTTELLGHIAERAEGGLRDAVMTLDQVTRVGVKTVEEFALLLGEHDFAPDVVGAMARGDVETALSVLDDQLGRTGDVGALSSALARCLVDILRLSGGGTVRAQGAALRARQDLAASIGAERAYAALRVIWDLKTKVRFGEDQRGALEVAVVLGLEAMSQHYRALGIQAAQAQAATQAQAASVPAWSASGSSGIAAGGPAGGPLGGSVVHASGPGNGNTPMTLDQLRASLQGASR